MSLEDYLSLDDLGWQYLRSIDAGDFVENPFSKNNTFSTNKGKVEPLKKKIKDPTLSDDIIKEIRKELSEEFDTDFDTDIDYDYDED